MELKKNTIWILKLVKILLIALAKNPYLTLLTVSPVFWSSGNGIELKHKRFQMVECGILFAYFFHGKSE